MSSIPPKIVKHAKRQSQTPKKEKKQNTKTKPQQKAADLQEMQKLELTDRVKMAV